MGEPRAYTHGDVTVTFEGSRCIHAAECVRGLPAVFDTARRPWIQPAGAPADEIARVVARCPTGALRMTRRDAPPEAPDERASITATADGPLYVRGRVRVVDDEGRVVDAGPRLALCRCGRTGNVPFCDGSHAEAGFRAP
ncbi:MAG: (4Fe-4S)-binding protein [Thermoleophilia bacterium]|jgi:uncharacterized Fe-S cluster protein YjdI|nr:(4Fe-4S)-binding protein [Thermoleophilia bacterium]